MCGNLASQPPAAGEIIVLQPNDARALAAELMIADLCDRESQPAAG